MKQAISTIIQWLIILAIIAGIVLFFRHDITLHWFEGHIMNGLQVIFFSLSLAFFWVYILQWIKFTKPFNCLKCLTGWIALLLAWLFNVEYWPLYLFAGLFAGAIVDRIIMRL